MSVSQDNLYPTVLDGTRDGKLGLGFPSQHLCQGRSPVERQRSMDFSHLVCHVWNLFAGQLDIYAVMKQAPSGKQLQSGTMPYRDCSYGILLCPDDILVATHRLLPHLHGMVEPILNGWYGRGPSDTRKKLTQEAPLVCRNRLVTPMYYGRLRQ